MGDFQIEAVSIGYCELEDFKKIVVFRFVWMVN